MNLGNELKLLAARYRILRALNSDGSPVPFNELQKNAAVSSRTLFKHLQRFLDSRQGIVEKLKDTGKYRLTEHGKVYREKIRLELAERTRLGVYQSSPDIIEVDSIGRDYFCRGTITISSQNKLQYGERQRLDKVLTQAIRTIKPAIPQGYRHAKVSIIWHQKMQPT